MGQTEAPDVMERHMIPAGKVFIKAGEENSRAYVIQSGEVAAFSIMDDKKVEVARYAPGAIIAEMCLVADEVMSLSFEALVNTTVITVTRQDFQKRLQRVDKTVRNVLTYAMNKVMDYERKEMARATRSFESDGTAERFVRELIQGLPEDKKGKYENAILPIIQKLIYAVQQRKFQAYTPED